MVTAARAERISPRCSAGSRWAGSGSRWWWASVLCAACFDFEPRLCQGECCQGECGDRVLENMPAAAGGADAGVPETSAGATSSAGAGGAPASGGAAGAVEDIGAAPGAAGEARDAGARAEPGVDGGADAGASPPDPCGPALAAKPARLCLGAACLTLSCNQRQALSLWLDPTGLPEPGAALQSWPDRSGLANDARRQLDDPLYPLLVEEEARPVSSGALRRSLVLSGNWLSLPQPPGNPALRFGREEFLVLVAASVPATQLNETYLYSASDGLGELRLLLQPDCGGVLLGDRPGAPNAPFYLTGRSVGLYDGRTRLYGIRRRSADEIEVRLNGASERAIDCVDPALDVDAEENAFAALGTTGTLRAASSSRGRISAVVAFKGHLADEEVVGVEQFLCSALGVCGAVEPAPEPPSDPACDPDAPGLTSCLEDE